MQRDGCYRIKLRDSRPKQPALLPRECIMQEAVAFCREDVFRVQF